MNNTFSFRVKTIGEAIASQYDANSYHRLLIGLLGREGKPGKHFGCSIGKEARWTTKRARVETCWGQFMCTTLVDVIRSAV